MMLKRCYLLHQGVYAWMKESPNGEYVRYDDIAPLLEWLQEKAKEWQTDDPYQNVWDFGDELEAKLKEIGL